MIGARHPIGRESDTVTETRATTRVGVISAGAAAEQNEQSPGLVTGQSTTELSVMRVMDTGKVISN